MAEKHTRVTEVRETDPSDRVATTERPVADENTTSGAVLAKRIVYYIGGAIIVLLAVRLLLLLLAANQGNGFVDFVYQLSGFFASPFYGIFNYQPTYGQSVFEVSTIVAIIVYAVVTVGIGKLFTLGKRNPDVA